MSRPFYLFTFLLFLVSCTHDAYETGDSEYSYLKTDFVVAQTDGDAHVVSAITDDDTRLTFANPFKVSWASTPDSTYRAMLYYNMKDGSEQVAPVAMGIVYVLTPTVLSEGDSEAKKVDPVEYQSAWLSKNKKWINLSLVLKTGKANDDKAIQSVGLVCDSVVTGGNGNHTYYYTFVHDQGGVPEYYSTTTYFSIPAQQMSSGDVVRLSVNTYRGQKVIIVRS